MKKVALSIVLLSVISFGSFAQEISDDYNYNSLRPIRNADKMYENTLWWRMDLREKQNEAFFAQGNEMTQLLIDAVKSGVLRPFENDSLNARMTLNQFLENLKMDATTTPEPEDPWDDSDVWETEGEWVSDEESTGDEDYFTGAEAESEEYFAKQMPILDIKGNLVFDKKRSRMYREIESISIIIPGEYRPDGLDKNIATFSYKELVENVFVDNPNAIWFNSKNSIQHLNIQDAFDLALESAKLVKYSNPQDQYIDDIYNSNYKRALGASEVYKQQLLEYESNTWSN